MTRSPGTRAHRLRGQGGPALRGPAGDRGRRREEELRRAAPTSAARPARSRATREGAKPADTPGCGRLSLRRAPGRAGRRDRGPVVVEPACSSPGSGTSSGPTTGSGRRSPGGSPRCRGPTASGWSTTASAACTWPTTCSIPGTRWSWSTPCPAAGAVGTVVVLEIGADDVGAGGAVDAHGMDPATVLASLAALGGRLPPRTLLVGCPVAETGDGMGLTPAVAAAVDDGGRDRADLVTAGPAARRRWPEMCLGHPGTGRRDGARLRRPARARRGRGGRPQGEHRAARRGAGARPVGAHPHGLRRRAHRRRRRRAGDGRAWS